MSFRVTDIIEINQTASYLMNDAKICKRGAVGTRSIGLPTSALTE